MNKEIEISPRQIAKAINDLLDEKEKLEQENKELHNKIDNAIEYIENNGEKQYNHHDNYRGKWYSPNELDTILAILKDSDVDE